MSLKSSENAQTSEVAELPAYAESDQAKRQLQSPTHKQSAMSSDPQPETSQPLSLIIDGQLILPSTIPATALYQLSHSVDMYGVELSICRVGKHTRVRESTYAVPYKVQEDLADRVIYNVSRNPMDLLRFDLRGQRRSTLPGTIEVVGGWTGWKIWHVRNRQRNLLFMTPLSVTHNYTWKDANGKLVAKESRIKIKPKTYQRHFDMQVVLEPIMQELLIACWIGRVWCELCLPYQPKDKPSDESKKQACQLDILVFWTRILGTIY
jgi:hypothetical protein